MRRTTPLPVCFLALALSLAGCSSYMHGYTQDAARGHYLIVDESTKNFGYKRVTYIVGYRGKAIEAFLQEKGLPNYIYEFKQGKREGFNFYYLKEKKAYVFIEDSWAPDSARLKETRPLNPEELNRFNIKAD